MSYFFCLSLFTLLVSIPAISSAESKLGLELNPYMTLASSLNNDVTYLSGGIDYFPSNEMLQISLPVVYAKPEHVGMTVFDYEQKAFSVDLAIKLFPPVKFRSISPYFDVFTRYTHLRGTDNIGNISVTSTEKLGVGMSIGTRSFSKLNSLIIYYGVRLSFGKYIAGENNIFGIRQRWFQQDYDKKDIIDIEFAKIGVIL